MLSRSRSPEHSLTSDNDETADIVEYEIVDNGSRQVNGETENLLEGEVVYVRGTQPEAPAQKSWLRTFMFIIRVLLACLTSNYSYPVAPQPLDEFFIFFFCMMYFELTTGIYHAASCDRKDVQERLRIECRGNAALGLVALSSKVTYACAIPGAVGLTKGFVQAEYAAQIAASPALVRFTSPLLSRNIAALVSLPLYMVGRKLIGYVFPSPNYNYGSKRSLTWYQKILMYALRMLDAISIYKLISAELRAYGAGFILHYPHAIVGAVIVDQLLVNLIDRIAFDKPALDPFAHIQELRPVSSDLEAALPRVNQLARADNAGGQDENVVERYARRGQVYRGSHKKIQCSDTGKVFFYSGRIIVVLGMVAMFNMLINLMWDDKENLPEPQFTACLSALLAMAILVEAGFQYGVPWAYHKISNATRNCHWPRLFSRDNPPASPAPQVIVQDDDALEEVSPLLTHLALQTEQPIGKFKNH